MRALLASYYGLTNDEVINNEDEIDSSEFSAEHYVRQMLQTQVGRYRYMRGIQSTKNKMHFIQTAIIGVRISTE